MNRFILLFAILAFISNTAIAQNLNQSDILPDEGSISFEAHQAGLVVVEDTEEITDDWFSGSLDLSFIDASDYDFEFHNDGLITREGDQIYWSRDQGTFLNDYYFTFSDTELVLDSSYADNEFIQEPVWVNFSPGQTLIEYPIEPGYVLVEEVILDGDYFSTDTMTYIGMLDEYTSPYGSKEDIAVFKLQSSNQPSSLQAAYILYDFSLPFGMILNIAQIDVYVVDDMTNFLFQEWDFRNINLGTTIDEVIIANDIKLYPNPTQDVLNIRSSENQHLKILDSRGRNVDQFYCNSFIQTFDVSSLEPGLYLLKGEQGQIQRFIVASGL